VQAVIRRLQIAVVALLVLGGPALAAPSQELRAARDAYRDNGCAAAKDLLNDLLYPRPMLADESELAQAHFLLGACYVEEGNLPRAEREFRSAYDLDPALEPDPGTFPREVIDTYRRTRDEIERVQREEQERLERARETDRVKRILENMVVLEKRAYWVNFVPFGAGQFQNGQRRKGAFFFASQATAFGASVSLYGYQVSRYGFRGEVPRDEVESVRRLQTLQIATGFVFWGLVAWGVIDSLSNFEHAVSRTPDPRILEELEQLDDPGAEPPIDRASSSSLKLLPMLGPDGAGVGLSWEF
jgi:tetratricopeptide (TPR) repeat protein